MSVQPDYDVIVIGGGGAGMAAAITAADAGARVALLECSDRLGGSTALSGGIFYASCTAQQAERGISDSIEATIADLQAINPHTPVSIHQAYALEAAPALAWLQSLGVNYPADRLASPNGRTVPRSHEPIGFGLAVAEALDKTLHSKGIDIAFRNRVDRLLCDGATRVIGVEIEGQPITAGAVIVATGGIGASAELVHRLLPKTDKQGDWVWHVGNPTSRGDGIRLGEAIGAAIGGADGALLLTTPGFSRDFEVIGPAWLAIVNAEGERIVAEDGGYWEIAEALERQPHGRGWAIFDARLLAEQALPHPRVKEALEQGSVRLSWVTEILQEQIASGKVLAAPDLASLAAKAGIDAAGLERSIARYNAFVAVGTDADFGKMPDKLHAIKETPVFAAEVRPALLVVTGAGLMIDSQTRVLDAKGDPIPGLFAAGETTGSVFGRQYVGTGYAMGSAIIFGRIAGREAARR
jgi:fumarate reductase flavoprotein subunit